MPKLNKKFSLHFHLWKLLFSSAVMMLFSSFDPPHPHPYGLTKVVIDAGHGGHDTGCLGKKTKEKDVALSIALKLGEYITGHYPDVKVIYTRKKDEFVELHERADIANNAHADLFICIHCNSACYFDKKKKEVCSDEISGVESWVMGLHMTEANLEVAKRENEVVLLEKDYTRQYDGFDPNSPEANIIFSLYQNIYLDQSLRMASYVQQEVKSKGRNGRGVKQAGFLVLYKTTMPSILIETGFLSNDEEEKYLGSEKGQEDIATSIFHAFRSYKNYVEAGKTTSHPENDSEDIQKPDTNGSDKNDSQKENSDGSAAEKDEVRDLQWSVQFYSSPVKLSKTSAKLKGIKDVREDKEKGIYKYSAGHFDDPADAVKFQNAIRRQGFKDAFVIAFYKGEKISFKDAMKLMKEK